MSESTEFLIRELQKFTYSGGILFKNMVADRLQSQLDEIERLRSDLIDVNKVLFDNCNRGQELEIGLKKYGSHLIIAL